MLKKTLIAGAVLAASTGLAFANGGSYVAAAPHHTGGFYLGAAISGDFGHFDATTKTVIGDVTTKDETEFGSAGVGGDLFGGYGMTFQNQYYAALELFGSISSLDVDLAKSTTNGNLDARAQIELKYSYGVSFIPGYMLTDTAMVYGRIGYIRSKFGQEFEIPGVVSRSHSDKLNGIQLGLGVDAAVTNNVSIRAEYVYNHYFNSVGGADDKNAIFGAEFDPRVNQVKVGIVYHFTDMGGMFHS